MQNFRNQRSMRAALILSLALLLLLPLCGCLTFGKKTTVEKPPAGEPSATQKEKTAFDSAREEQSDLAAYAASAGRKNPKDVKEVPPGQTFLLSSKAKEIYKNTERD